LLILVGVVLDTMRQIETKLIDKQYDSFFRKAPSNRNRYAGGLSTRAEEQSQGTMIWVYVLVAIVVIIGVSYWVAARQP
jgi:hypothetical protein